MANTGEGLVFEGTLPMSFQVIDSFPKDGQLALINEANESFLRTSLILHETTEVDENNEISLELKRQDLKINLLLELLAELLAQQNMLPGPVMIKLTAAGIKFPSQADKSFSGQKIELSLYISPGTPKALKLFGEVLESNEQETVVLFFGISQGVKDWLEKIIFRHHRRTIAQGLELK